MLTKVGSVHIHPFKTHLEKTFYRTAALKVTGNTTKSCLCYFKAKKNYFNADIMNYQTCRQYLFTNIWRLLE